MPASRTRPDVKSQDVEKKTTSYVDVISYMQAEMNYAKNVELANKSGDPDTADEMEALRIEAHNVVSKRAEKDMDGAVNEAALLFLMHTAMLYRMEALSAVEAGDTVAATELLIKQKKMDDKIDELRGVSAPEQQNGQQ